MLLMMMMVVVTMRMVVEVMIEVVVNNIFAQLCFEILSQYDNSLSQDDNSFHTMIILSYKMSILSLPALPLRALSHVFSSSLLIEAPCLLIQPQ